MPARREGSLGAKSSGSDPRDRSSRAVPASNPSDEVGNDGARVRGGSNVPNEWLRAAPSVALVPGVPEFGGVAPRHGRPSSVRVRAWRRFSAGDWLRSACHRRRVGGARSSQGTGWWSRAHQSTTAACSGRRRSAAHRSRALPPAPPRKQGKTFVPRCAANARLRAEREPCNGHGPRHCRPHRVRGG